MDMLDNLLSVGLVAFILFICAAIYFKDKKETKHLLLTKKIFLSKKINNRKVIIKEFSKTLESLRDTFKIFGCEDGRPTFNYSLEQGLEEFKL